MEKTYSLKSMASGIVKIVAFFIAVQIVQELLFVPLSKISTAYWSSFDGDGLNEPWFFTTSIAILVSALIVCYLFLKFVDKKQWSFIRLTSNKYLKKFAAGSAISIAIVVLFTVVNLLLGNSELATNVGSALNILLYFFLLVTGGLALVIYEELIFRGYFLKIFESHFNLLTAIILSSLLFSVAHFLRPNASYIGLINIFLGGIFLAIVCIYHNNLWAPIGFHFGWNFFLWFFNYPVSGQRYPNPVLKLNYNDYNLLIGSKFGPEDSLLLTALLLAAVLYFFFKSGLKEKK